MTSALDLQTMAWKQKFEDQRVRQELTVRWEGLAKGQAEVLVHNVQLLDLLTQEDFR